MKSLSQFPCEYWANKIIVRPDALSIEELNGLQEHMYICAQCQKRYIAAQQFNHDLQGLFGSLRLPQREAHLAYLKAYHATQKEGPGQLAHSQDASAKVHFHRSRSAARFHLHLPHLYLPLLPRLAIGVVMAFLLLVSSLNFPLPLQPSVEADTLLPYMHAHYPRGGTTGWVHTVAWSPKGNIIASIWSDNLMEVWDAHTGAKIEIFHTEVGWGAGLAWSPDGKFLATISIDDTIQILNIAACRTIHACNPVTVYKNHTAPINALAWSPDGTKIASASDDRTVQVWDSKTGTHLYTYKDNTYRDSEVPGKFTALAWSPDSQNIVSGDNNGHVQIWSALTGQLLINYPGHFDDPITSVNWSPDGNSISSAGYKGIVQIWNAKTGKTLSTISSHTDDQNGDQNEPIYAAAWSPYGKFLVLASYNTVQVRVVETGEILGKPYHFNNDHSSDDGNNSLFTVAWSPDGQHIVCGGQGVIFDFNLHG